MKNEHEPTSLPEEWSAPPEEFPEPAPELLPPPEEFPPVPAPAQEEDGARRRRRRLLYFLAAGALILLLLPRLRLMLAPILPGTEAPAGPASTPEPTPEPSPEPTPEPEPGYEILYYSFSSDHFAQIRFTVPEAFTSVDLELWEPILGVQVDRRTLTPEEIASGRVDLNLGNADDLYFERLDEYRARNTFPEELELRITVRYEGKEGTVTEKQTLMPSPEQGWSVRYWPKTEEKTDWSFPGYFRFETYESYTPVALVLNDPGAVKSGVISVSFSIDGRKINADQISYDTRQEAYTIGGEPVSDPFYRARFLFPKPDWAPESGVLHVTVVQYLDGYGQTVVIERDYPYSEKPESESEDQINPETTPHPFGYVP